MALRRDRQANNDWQRERPYASSPEGYVASLGDEPDQVSPRPRRYRMPRPRGPRLWPRLVALVLVFAILGLASYAAYLLVFIVAKISTEPLELGGLVSDGTGRVNILVLGVGDPGHAGEGLSDTMMVVSLDTQSKRVAQISIPRDLRVPLPGYGFGKINEANALGGVKLAEQTVSNTLNIPIHYYVRTDFSGLRQLVDAVGGVDVDVKARLIDPEYPCDNDQYKACGLDIDPGLQHMNGVQVLQYARCRKGTCGDDFGRAARQQEIMNLVREKVVKWEVLSNPAKLIPVVEAVRSGVQTDLGPVQMMEFGQDWQEAQKHQPVQFVLSTSPGGYLVGAGNSSDLLPVGGSFNQIQQRVQNIFAK